MESRESLSLRRGDACVCIDASGGGPIEACLRSVLAHTAESVPILVSGASEADPAAHLGQPGRRVVTCGGGVESALASAGPADVAVLSAQSRVADGWIDELRQVAHSDARVATVSALMAADGTETVGVPPEMTFDQAAATIRAASPRMHPRLAGPYGSCVYVRRSALEFIGSFGDWDLFSSRCLRSGLSHLLADEVLVEVGEPRLGAGNPAGPLGRSLAAARRRLGGLSLLLDLRLLSAQTGGTRLHALELLGALSRTNELNVKALVIDEGEAAPLLSTEMGSRVEAITVARAQRSGFRADVVHRPYQIGTPADLGILGGLGDRLVITHQDLIGYQNPCYFDSREHWEGYRAITRRAFAAADQVIFPSRHARAEALAEGLVEPGRTNVVRHGVDHVQVRPGRQAPVQPAEAKRLPADAELMLCIGTDYWHKNRLFAIRILECLRGRHGWRGWLVLAGAHMRWGSSAAEEADLLARAPALAEAVLDVGEVSEGEKDWLLSKASLVVYPTAYEGFGLVPFEAADRGVPCLWANGTALSEVLPDEAAGFEPWDVERSAAQALQLMTDRTAAERNLRAIREAGTRLRWDFAARQLVEIYRDVCDRLPAAGGVNERQEGGLMGAGLSEDALRLVGPAGALPPELERPLLALAMHRRLSRPLFGALKAGYRASARLARKDGGLP